MKITIAIKNHYAYGLFKSVFENAKFEEFDVEIIYGDLFVELKKDNYDLIITPGNSFGIMDGGFDAEVNEYFNGKIERTLTKYLKYEELHVGKSVTITDNNNVDVLYAPTMRTPGKLHYGSINVYIAFYEAIKAALNQNYKNVIVPAFGIGFGSMHPKVAAVQMYMALKLYEEPVTKWEDIYRSQRIIETGELLTP